jgi:enamine deaminase RidA (YjgF/YER057c/UK114 family)
MQVQFINTTALASPVGYSHVAAVSDCRMIFVSGQVAYNAKGKLVGKGNLRAQAKQVYENISLALQAAGATFGHVIKVNAYVVKLNRTSAKTVRDVRAKYMPSTHVPASTMVGTTGLTHPDLLIEVEVVAAVRA